MANVSYVKNQNVTLGSSFGQGMMLRAATWAPAEGAGGATGVASWPSRPDLVPGISTTSKSQVAAVDITTADFLLSIGRGVGERENIPMFEELAGKMGATLGVSRPLVDAGWMPASRQVGQSGKTVKPKVYLAFGDLRRSAASRRHENRRHDHRGQHRSGGRRSSASPTTAPPATSFEVAEELEKLY